MIVYFSGTGNSRYAAESLAHQLGEELLDAGVPDMVMDALGAMLCDDPEERCTMDLVREIFDVEIR